ncbi:MAG: hypothetical protein EFT35_01415 [Methanophagales archaeon ANME-1-THS]|nr:MAG: hypothetical protein EFT35_01415 [Methanophagales archaeon ANME-1-THS]
MESAQTPRRSRLTLLELLKEEDSEGDEIIGIFFGKNGEEELNKPDTGSISQRLKLHLEGTEI